MILFQILKLEMVGNCFPGMFLLTLFGLYDISELVVKIAP